MPDTTITRDPANVPHHTDGPCSATWRRVTVTNVRTGERTGYASQFGYPKCADPGTINRFVKAAHSNRYIPVYTCPGHTR
ncbi:hypothetical protein AB0N09_28115 [Streptomyces erythrochromogenes]|uniref:hypothetical protein n=1 Tax=Streptomyces erythrochromogenes TaxID=285574 RepID=UPI00341CED36